MSLTLDADTLQNLEQVKTRLSHILSSAGYTEVIQYLITDYLKRLAPRKGSNPKDNSQAKMSSQFEKESESKERYQLEGKPAKVCSQPKESSHVGKRSQRKDFSKQLPPSTAAAVKQGVNPKSTRYIPLATRRAVFLESGNQCEYIAPGDQRRCESRYQLEIDHIFPKSLGGGDEPENLRCLCRVHNQHVARLILGTSAMKRRRSQNMRI